PAVGRIAPPASDKDNAAANGMTLQQLDEALKVWKGRMSAIAENLLELQCESTYQSLTGSGGLDKLTVTGVTAARVGPALGAMHTMFQQYGLLQSVVDQAETLRSGLPSMFGGEAKLREAESLLFGRSIQVPAVNMPLEQRTLLDGLRSEERITPEELLQPMMRSFAAARDAVMAVGNSWAEFAGRVDRIETEIARLRAQNALPTAVLAPSLDAIVRALEEVRGRVTTDPLGALGELHPRVESPLAAVAQRVSMAEQIRRQLLVARGALEELRRLHAEALATLTEARSKITQADALPECAAEEKLIALREWLGRLERKREEVALDAVAVGLRNWNAATEACAAQEKKVLATGRARVEARSELRGRLDALKAKARAYGMAERAEVAALGSTAEAMLYARPTDLDGAAAAVARYEEQLRGVRRANAERGA
ncbi:MAG TPA: hypothetical protein VKV02_02180, partial [Acidobacteriaceae bacterium]|nr:hypothetical protein [Acidobacteriaceae bacterium]